MKPTNKKQERDWTDFDEFIREKMRRTRLPAVSLSVTRTDEVLHSRGYGFRDLSRSLPASAHTVYGIASVSKSFTALAISKLAEEGKLSANDPVDRFLPLRLRPHGERILVRHLLTHSSGVPALAYAEAEGTDRYLTLSSVEDFVAWLNGAQEWVEASPGERWFYLNEGYILLGGIVEQLTGRSFAEYVREYILRPLDMEETGFIGENLGPEVAVPYMIPSAGQPKEGKVLPCPIGSDGGLASTVVDMGKYLRMFLRQGSPLIGPESYKEMVTPRVNIPYIPAPFLENSQGSYAYGLRVEPFLLGRTLIGHSGSVGVYTAHMGFLPEKGLGAMVLANGTGYPCVQLAKAALAWAVGEELEKLPFVRLEKVSESIAGTYATYQETMRAIVRPRGGALELTMEDQEAPETIILTVDELGKEEVLCRAHLGDHLLPVVFRCRGSQVELLYERYKLRRL